MATNSIKASTLNSRGLGDGFLLPLRPQLRSCTAASSSSKLSLLGSFCCVGGGGGDVRVSMRVLIGFLGGSHGSSTRIPIAALRVSSA